MKNYIKILSKQLIETMVSNLNNWYTTKPELYEEIFKLYEKTKEF